MVFFRPFIGTAAILASFVAARPMPDSAIGAEIPVSAPNGIPMSDVAQPTGSSNYGSSNYGSSNYGSSGDSSSSMMMDSSSMMMESSSTMMMDSSSTMMMDSTSSAMMSYSTPSYGSGGSNWGGSGYDSCVQRKFSFCLMVYRVPIIFSP